MITRAENISPLMLTWARETAGLSVQEAAKLLGLNSSTRGTASEKLEAFECGEVKPTRNQLFKIAATYKRPLTAFYCLKPPIAGDRGEDFRTMDKPVSKREVALLNALLRDIHVRQDMVKSILEDDEDVQRLAFVGSVPVTLSVPDAAKIIRQTLGFGQSDISEYSPNSVGSLFAALRERAENIGVFVLLAGNLGSYHTNISEQVFRGFAIADNIAPFIVINDQDAIPARSFTLIHELTHIFMGSTGVSSSPSTITPSTGPARIERFCNDVAGEFLLPEDSLHDIGMRVDVEVASQLIQDIASSRKVSEPMVAYRFWRTGRIVTEHYRKLADFYAKRWMDVKNRKTERSRDKGGGGPSYYAVRKHQLGNALISLVGRTLKANELTHTKAAKMLGVTPINVEQLLRGVESVSGSYSVDKR